MNDLSNIITRDDNIELYYAVKDQVLKSVRQNKISPLQELYFRLQTILHQKEYSPPEGLKSDKKHISPDELIDDDTIIDEIYEFC